MRMHEDQLDVTGRTARLLVDDQFPQWRHLPLRRLATSATVNTIYRLGDGLTVRFPLVGESAEQERAALQAEADASAEFAAVSPVPAPEPVALGDPGHSYPLPWSVQTWVPGQDTASEDPAAGGRGSLAGVLDAAGFAAADPALISSAPGTC